MKTNERLSDKLRHLREPAFESGSTEVTITVADLEQHVKDTSQTAVRQIRVRNRVIEVLKEKQDADN
ncbi:hypothetical protein ACFL2Q_20385 [Thermodesulfobacteriota bacterium]